MRSDFKEQAMSRIETMQGKVAVITGGASGIGRGIAERMIAQGALVVIADIDDERLQATAREIGATGIRTDVTSSASVQALADAVLSLHGKVDILCNNAGIGPMAAISDLTLNDWKWMLDVNLWGVIHGIHSFLPLLKANADGGHIVNTSSMSGMAVTPTLGAYAVAKFGVVALSEVLAQELEIENSKVGVSVLCPGPVRTNIGNSSRNRPKDLGEGHLADVDLESTEHFRDVHIPWVSPAYTGDLVIDAIKRGDLYVLTHPELFDFIHARHKQIAESVEQALARQQSAASAVQ
ncbi:SDR family NAD(P)-dependent oxidoreductase [Pseudomonas proteolytica]|nr:SDR family NAD(P)-dependent oxidoreductase [Pseudomonas proteolytica]